ncbi:hypothetical protein [Neobacillus dielmonensis]|uniref:hypothetical protein n=1 Tax=Neobacillus dielmonensis TaxID=1347369 RepID=UPI0005AB8C39|nr:hypothetical protein [Neobacillus dielmonensis]
MSEHLQFLAQREQIDILIGKGYRIQSVKEHLNGATVEFFDAEGNQQETLLVGNANARKYLSSLLVKQNQLST